jgi:hypothetical protein
MERAAYPEMQSDSGKRTRVVETEFLACLKGSLQDAGEEDYFRQQIPT